MLLSEIGNKEIVDLSTGCSHGELWNAELLFEKKKRQNKSGARTIDTKHRPVSKSSRRTVSASLEQYCHHRRGHDHFSILSTESLNQIRLQLFFRTALKMSPCIVVFNINGNESSGKCCRIDTIQRGFQIIVQIVICQEMLTEFRQ